MPESARDMLRNCYNPYRSWDTLPGNSWMDSKARQTIAHVDAAYRADEFRYLTPGDAATEDLIQLWRLHRDAIRQEMGAAFVPECIRRAGITD